VQGSALSFVAGHAAKQAGTSNPIPPKSSVASAQFLPKAPW